MAKIRPDKPLLPSVLDRLIDDGEEGVLGMPKSHAQSLRELKMSVRRDLQNLLNTRWRCSHWPPDLDELDDSLVNYGIPDFTCSNMSRRSARDELREIIRQVIVCFEPRLDSVQVTLMKNEDKLDRTLHFRIEAMLRVKPAPEPVEFRSSVEPTTGEIEIESPER
jgi:type VI secretion system protein ImpF